MLAYILRRLMLVIPTLFGIMVINFFIVQAAPGGPVEQMISQIQGTAIGATFAVEDSGRHARAYSAAGIACFLAVSYLKKALGYDDALDAFGVHAVGGIVGAILTGVFVDPAKGGAGYVTDGWLVPTFGYDAGQIWIQVKAVGIAIVWSAVVSAIALLICKFTVGLRVTEEQESEGLDISEHGETAYHD